MHRLIAAIAVAPALAMAGDPCTVVSVHDGDTLTARCGTPGAYQQVTVRIAAIDAPERKQAFGQRARQHLAQLCFRQRATLRPLSRDAYGRTVANVRCGRTDVAAAQVGAGPRCVRGVVTANVASLSAFTVAGNDGLTYAAGERVLLAGQTTAAQNGIYVVGTVGGGTAALTRATDFAASAAIVNGCVVEVSEGTLWAGSSWKAMCTGAKVVATDDPLFYPRTVKATVTLASGVYALGATEGLYLFSTTKSKVTATYNTPDTITLSVALKCAVADRTAGKSGTAAATVKAVKADASTNTADVSTVDVVVTNW